MKNNIVKIYHLVLLLFVVNACGQKQATPTLKQSENTTTMEKIDKTAQEWKEILTPEEYRVLREKGTEYAFTGDLLDNKKKGIYTCAGCGNELFSDEMKFNSGTGWPSFDAEIEGGKITKHVDKSHGMTRTEITCAKCDGHLGHLFYDGSTKTQQRYCVNSVSLNFKEQTTHAEDKKQKIVFGGGCFWCVEAAFLELKGVEKVVSGYSGGTIKNPAYREVTTGRTGHAEVIEVTYDSEKILLEELLEVFFVVHDPTTLNKQGADVGSQYRSAIYYVTENQKSIIDKVISVLNQSDVFDGKIVTEVAPLGAFYKAEEYHQNYYNQNKSQPYCQLVIAPKIEKVQKAFKDKLKK